MPNDTVGPTNQIRFGNTTPLLPVADLRTSLVYYAEKLGFTIDWQAHDLFASVSRDKCSLFLAVGDQGTAPTWVWIGVGDAAALFDEYIECGARVVHAPTNYEWALEIQVTDPDGNVLRLGSDPDECGLHEEWRDMRGDYWVVNPESGWTKVEAAAGAPYFLDQAAQAKQARLYRRARSCFFNAVELLRANGTKAELARALRELGEVERGRQNTAAQLHYDESIALFRELSEPWPLAHALGHLGMLHKDLGRDEFAESCYREALAVAGGIDELNALDLANTVNRFATFLDEKQRDAEAEPLLQEANDLYARAKIQAGVAGTGARLARGYYRRGNAEQAEVWMAKAKAAALIANEQDTHRFINAVKQEISG
jgi:tetratricopeptide (TPR) repeat protein